MKKTNGSKLRHIVLFSFKDNTPAETIAQIIEAFCELPQKIAEISEFEWGVNNSPEKLNQGLTHCFTLTFNDEESRDRYLPHPAHKAFGKLVQKHLDNVLVFDYWNTTIVS